MTHRTPRASFIADFDRIWSAGLGPSDARDTVSTADDDLLQQEVDTGHMGIAVLHIPCLQL